MHPPLILRWLGVAGIELSAGRKTLAIDPFFTRPPLRRAWFGRVSPERELARAKIPRCDAVLVSHAHYDHLMDVPGLALDTGAAVFGSANTCELLRVFHVPEAQIREIRAGGRFRIGDFAIETLPGEHRRIPGFRPGTLRPGLRPPLRLRDYRMDACLCFLIQAGNLRLLHCGGAHPMPAARAEVLLTSPLGDPAYFASLLSEVQPGLIVPVHWDDFFRPLSRPLRPMLEPPSWAWPPLQRVDLFNFKATIGRIDSRVRVLIPEIFRPYELGRIFRGLSKPWDAGPA